jgi:ABC-2 type transport system ATP-binding protein
VTAPPPIELSGLTKRYGDHVGIESLDLRVESGQVFGFLGPNGAGKTTTIRCLVGLLSPSAGKARVLGLDPIAEHRDLAPRIGYLPGELRLYLDLTGAEHLELLGDLQGGPTPRRGELCERLLLSDADLAKPVRAYSHGMKQKIGIVQAFQHEPELVILDEPTEGLDPLIQETFFALVAETARAGRTVFLSSHILSEVQRACERVAIVRSGRLVTVERVDILRNAHTRRVRVTFDADFDHGSITLDARWTPEWIGDELHLLVNPDEVVETTRQLLTFPARDLTVEEAGLDEAFLDFYRQPDDPTSVRA